MKNKLWKKLFLGVVLVFIAIQFYPYGRDHNNPPVTNQVKWDSDFTKETFYNACADCHSNETNWPWYSHLAPVSWLIQSDVEKGRRRFNISVREGLKEADEAYEEVEKGEMPLPIYLPLHPKARFDDIQKDRFIAGLKATFNNDSESTYKKKND
ncbi:putative cytochrome c [hydrocarbon metagenome]|uniref:Putative cytochrome c n=1 Tax=hydrocarbon metagenome TaxID=938273 RepID=A0A0W8FXA7_9ZZZZ